MAFVTFEEMQKRLANGAKIFVMSPFSFFLNDRGEYDDLDNPQLNSNLSAISKRHVIVLASNGTFCLDKENDPVSQLLRKLTSRGVDICRDLVIRDNMKDIQSKKDDLNGDNLISFTNEAFKYEIRYRGHYQTSNCPFLNSKNHTLLCILSLLKLKVTLDPKAIAAVGLTSISFNDGLELTEFNPANLILLDSHDHIINAAKQLGFNGILCSHVELNNILANEVSSLDQQDSLQQLLSDVKATIKRQGPERLNFGTIELQQFVCGAPSKPVDIDNAELNRLITRLEAENTALADYTCALLLASEINSYDEIASELSEEDYKLYFSKRLHDAITFYLKAARDPELKPLVCTNLWELKVQLAETNSAYQSVVARLAMLDVQPSPECVSSVATMKEMTHSVQRTLPVWFFNPPVEQTIPKSIILMPPEDSNFKR